MHEPDASMTSHGEPLASTRGEAPLPVIDALLRHLEGALMRDGLGPSQCALFDGLVRAGQTGSEPRLALLRASIASTFAERGGWAHSEESAQRARGALPSARFVAAGAGELLPSQPVNAVAVAADLLLPRPWGEGGAQRSTLDEMTSLLRRAIRAMEGCRSASRGYLAIIAPAELALTPEYGAIREELLSHFRLETLIELGPELVTPAAGDALLALWALDPRGQAGRSFRFARLDGERTARLSKLVQGHELGNAWHRGALLAAREDGQHLRPGLRAQIAPVGALAPLSFPALRVAEPERFIDRDRARLAARMASYFELGEGEPPRPRGRFSQAALRPIARKLAAPHRFQVREDAMGWIYYDPALESPAPHRLGSFDPFARGPKLLLELGSSGLAAAVLHGAACVEEQGHTLVLPLYAPAELLSPVDREVGSGGHEVLNLTPRWREVAHALDEPSDLFYCLAAAFNSSVMSEQLTQGLLAPNELPLPSLAGESIETARELARLVRGLCGEGRENLSDEGERLVMRLYRAVEWNR